METTKLNSPHNSSFGGDNPIVSTAEPVKETAVTAEQQGLVQTHQTKELERHETSAVE